MTIDKLKQIYEDYFSDVNAALKESSMGTLFSSYLTGNRVTDACSGRFAEKVEKALAEFDFETEDAAEIIDFVLSKGEEKRDDIRIGMMMTAVQRYLLSFPEHISREKAAEFLCRFNRSFPRRELTPVMKDFKKALEKRVG